MIPERERKKLQPRGGKEIGKDAKRSPRKRSPSIVWGEELTHQKKKRGIKYL